MHLLEIKSLTKTFTGLVAVNELNLYIDKQDILGVIGPNGAGKTTLFNLITGFYSPDRGEIRFKERNLVGLKPFEICSLGVARTFQIVRPFANLSVLENVMIGSFNRASGRMEAEEKAKEILTFLNFFKKRDQKAGSLTRADRKRLELARALATEPEVILLDEVMAGLNDRETGELMELVKIISERGYTLLIIEHVMKAVMNLSNRIIVLNYGVKIAEGTPKEISSDQGVIKAYLGEEYAVA